MTKRLLREGLLELLEEKPIDRITVKELCERAELNRSTFYAYYTEVPALYEEMGNELADSLLSYVRAMGIQGKGFDCEPMLTYIRDNREMFRLLVYCEHYTELNLRTSKRIIQGFYNLSLDLKRPSVEQEYILQFLLFGGTGVIFRWVQNDCDLPPRQVAQMIGRMISGALGAK